MRYLPAATLALPLLAFAGPALDVSPSVPVPSRFDRLPVVEPHISTHPTDPKRLLAAAMVITDPANPYTSARLSSFVSGDGGKTWSETAHDWWGYDPWTAILPDGRAVLSWLGTEGRFDHRFPVVLLRSRDAGGTWEKKPQVLAGNHDGTKLVAHGDAIWFTTVRFDDSMGADPVLYRAVGDGPFRSVARIAGGGKRLNFCEPAALSDGTVVFPGSEFLKSAWTHRVAPDGKMAERRHVTDTPGGALGYMRLVSDTSATSPYRDRVYFVRAVGRGGERRGVWLNVSTDGGRSWGEDRRVDRFPGSPASHALVASPAVNRDGILAISWMDRQRAADPDAYDLYIAASSDGGRTFGEPVRVTRVGTDPRTDANDDVASKFPGGGHYLGMAARADGAFQPIWADSRDGVFRLRTATVRVKSASGGR